MVENRVKIPLPEGHDWTWEFDDDEDNCEEQFLVITVFPEPTRK